MKFYHSKIDNLKQRTASDRGQYHNVQRFFTLYAKDEYARGEKFSWHQQLVITKLRWMFAWSFEVGNAGSSTPFDGHITIFGSSYFWGFSRGSRLAQWLTTSKVQKYGNRELSFRLDKDYLNVSLWASDDGLVHANRSKFRRRNRSWRVNLFNIILGEKRYTYEDLETEGFLIDLPEDSYRVKVKVQKQSYGRKRSKNKEISYCLDVSAPKGIPDRPDLSGGWKGDRVYGFAVAFPGYVAYPHAWVEPARMLITSRILKDRGDSGFIKPDPIDD